jgi:ankyrin repeat protein
MRSINCCVCCCYSRMVEHLLRNGADPTLLDRHGYTVAHYAAFSGNKHALDMVR